VQVGVELVPGGRLDGPDPTGLIEREALIVMDPADHGRRGLAANAPNQGLEGDDVQGRRIHDRLKREMDVGSDQFLIRADMFVQVAVADAFPLFFAHWQVFLVDRFRYHPCPA